MKPLMNCLALFELILELGSFWSFSVLSAGLSPGHLGLGSPTLVRRAEQPEKEGAVH